MPLRLPLAALPLAALALPAPARAASPKQTAAAPERFVVVPGGTALFAAPDPAAPRGVTGTNTLLGPTPIAFRVASERGDWLEVVAPESDDGRNCFDTYFAAQSYGLHLFVHRADLATVTTREVDLTYTDGTSVHVAPGAVVRDGAVHTATVHLPLPVPPDATGVVYTPEPAPPRVEAPGALAAGTDPMLDGRPVPHASLGIPDASDEGGYAIIDGVREVRERTSTPRGELVTLRARCVGLRVLVPATSVSEPLRGAAIGAIGAGGLMGAGGGVFGSLGGPRPLFVVRPGAPVTWPDGGAAGETREEIALTARPARAPNGRACAPLRLGGEADGAADALRVCFPAAAVRPLPRRRR